jgi:hypothetical protein
VAVSDELGRYAVLSREEHGAGVTLDSYSFWVTTTVEVFERGGRRLLEERHHFEESASGSGVTESGDVIESFALSADGLSLELTLRTGGRIVRAL